MGFLFNRSNITHINNPDDDFEDFNSLYEIKALDDLDPAEEEAKEIFSKSLESSSKSTPEVQEPDDVPIDDVHTDRISESEEPTNESAVSVGIPVIHSGVDPVIEDPMDNSKKPGVQGVFLATKSSDKLVKPQEKKGIVWNNKGVTLSRLGKYDEAIKAYDQALQIDPEYTSAWNNKGVVLSKLGKYPEALEAFDRALRIRSGIIT
ncbi:tetratricopeptide repeat protein [Methanospirillum lacunae]|uniref:Uncharacterized protein n=1 Tax=Methanospirillum lacunae TaxID=668570 RepID=A0A2V2NDC7_9EURY|nr:tetratricopeptide repeat protein [Methanospirillum lacunae]PWR74367.1 hypothetical protein DK846_04245 [Methanospirillum lacunae]